MRRLVIVLLALLAGPVLGPMAGGFVAPAAAQADPPTAEAEFVERINQLRADKGLGRLTVHPELVAVARGWAAEMARRDQISHNPDLADSVRADWEKLGENVGVGMTVEKLHAAFVASPAHYRNLVDGAFTHVGVAVVLGRDGAIFTTHQFMQLRPGAAAAAAKDAAPPTTSRAAPTTAAPTPAPLPAGRATVGNPPPGAGPGAPPARLVLVLQQLRALDAR